MVWLMSILIMGPCASLLVLCFYGRRFGRFRHLKRCLFVFCLDCSLVLLWKKFCLDCSLKRCLFVYLAVLCFFEGWNLIKNNIIM